MTELERLQSILAAPRAPFDVPSNEDLARASQRLPGLPDDYVQFLRSYGTGYIDAFLWVLNPAASNTYLNICDEYDRELEWSRGGGGPIVYSVGGLFHGPKVVPYATNDNAGRFCWLVNGPSPNDWPTLVRSSYGEIERFDMPTLTFLRSILDGTVTSRFLPDDFPSVAPAFTPMR